MKERVWMLFGNVLIELTNVSKEDNRFITDPKEVYSLLSTFGEPRAIVHTHERSCSPSALDLESIKAWKDVDWIIVSPNCVKAFRLSANGNLEEIDLDPLLLQVLYDLIVEAPQ